MHARVGIILQARFNSSRLPGKALAAVGGVSILERCLIRLRKAEAGCVVLATTERAEDDALVMVARQMGIGVFRGSTNDVLRRYVDAAVWHRFDLVIRATADNPGVDIDAPRRLLGVIQASRAEYACEDGLPCGAGVEIITTAALVRADALATSAGDREHVTTFVKSHPATFQVTRVAPPGRLQRPDVRLTVDTPSDLSFVRRVFSRVRSDEPTLTDLIAAADAGGFAHWCTRCTGCTGCKGCGCDGCTCTSCTFCTACTPCTLADASRARDFRSDVA